MQRASRTFRALLMAIVVCLVFVPVAARADEVPITAQSATWKRLSGDNRYSTMSAIASETFASSDWAVIATGDNFPDALAASALAGVKDCPLIITNPSQLSMDARAQLQRLGVKNAYVVGGPSSVSLGVEGEIYAMGISTVRVGGYDRYDTSLKVMNAVHEAGSISQSIILATGTNFPDALSVGGWAYATKTPIVLVGGNGMLSDAAVAAIKANSSIVRVIIVGGEDAVSEYVKTQLGEDTHIFERFGGPNRYATSTYIAQWELSQGFSLANAAIATGSNFPDALTGSALSGRTRSVLLLANSQSQPTWTFLKQNEAGISNGYILGGVSSVPLMPSGDAELDALLDSFITRLSGTGEVALKQAYDIIKTYPYVTMDEYPQGDWTTWSIRCAKEMYYNGKGNCYRYSSLMCWIARRLGFNAKTISGKLPSFTHGLVAHGWVELYKDGVTYTLDPCMEHSYPQYNLFMVTYANTPMLYHNLNDVRYV